MLKKIIHLISLIFLLFISFILTVSCKKNNTDKNAAKINDTIFISMDEVDQSIEHELYDELYKIYLRRISALDKIIDSKVLGFEASAKKMSQFDLLRNQINIHNNEKDLNNYKQLNGLTDVIPYYNNFLAYIPINSKLGEKLLHEGYDIYITKQYLADLKKKYKIKTFIDPPLPPKVLVDSLNFLHFKGKLDSKVKVIIVSDVECSICREATPVYQKLFEKYKNSVKFGYVSYSASVNIGIKALEAANIQNKYWQMYDLILQNPYKMDTLSYVKYAQSLGLDKDKFIKDLKDTLLDNQIKNNFEYLTKKKIYATPTLLINNRIIPDTFDEERIMEEIEKLL